MPARREWGMNRRLPVEIPKEKLAAFCRWNRIRKPPLFGPVL